MHKKIIVTVSVFAMGILFFLTSQVNAAPAETKRLWGNDRYQTCSEIVNEGWKNCDYAVIVNGENFPDALSASVLAKKYNAPILLTQSNNLDSNTRYQLSRLDVKKAFIVGGLGVVSSSVEEQLLRMNIQVQRFSGINRTETSIDVAHELGMKNGVILTTDTDFTDALSVASIGAKLQMPIILMPKEGLGDLADAMVEYEKMPKTYVLGGQDLISDNIVSSFPNVQRIDGKDKYERNIKIINTFADKFDFSNAFLAYSEKFADALSGSALAALNGNPIILIGDSPANSTKQFLNDKSNLINNLIILGGTAGIKDYEINDILSNSDSNDVNSQSTLKKLTKDQAIQILKNLGDTEDKFYYGEYIEDYSNPSYKRTVADDNQDFSGHTFCVSKYIGGKAVSHMVDENTGKVYEPVDEYGPNNTAIFKLIKSEDNYAILTNGFNEVTGIQIYYNKVTAIAESNKVYSTEKNIDKIKSIYDSINNTKVKLHKNPKEMELQSSDPIFTIEISYNNGNKDVIQSTETGEFIYRLIDDKGSWIGGSNNNLVELIK